MVGEPLSGKDLLRFSIRYYERYGRMPFPIKGGDGTETETSTTTPDPHATSGGDRSKQVVFPNQEAFEATLKNRIDQAQRSWERDERPKIVEDVKKQVTDEIKAEAERKAAEESGEFKKLYEETLNADDIAKLPKDSRLFAILDQMTKEITNAQTTVGKLVEDELKTLPDAMKALLPPEYTPDKKLDWIRNAKKAAGVADGKAHGNNHTDPPPGGTQGKTVEDVVNELSGRIPYGTGARGRFAGAATNGGS